MKLKKLLTLSAFIQAVSAKLFYHTTAVFCGALILTPKVIDWQVVGLSPYQWMDSGGVEDDKTARLLDELKMLRQLLRQSEQLDPVTFYLAYHDLSNSKQVQGTLE